MAYKRQFKQHSAESPDTDNPAARNVFDVPTPGVNVEPEAPKPFEPVHVEAKFTTEKIHVEDSKAMDDGLQKLLDYMPADCKELILEYVASMQIPLWHAIGGYIVRCREEGTLFAPVILPDWQEMVPANAIRACSTCGEALSPTTWGQRYCCEYCYFGKLSSFGHADKCALTKEKHRDPITEPILTEAIGA